MLFQNIWILLLLIFQVGFWVFFYFTNKNFSSIFPNESDNIGLIIKKRMNYRLFKWKNYLLHIGIFILIIAASGPQIGTRIQPVERKGVDLVIALDVSTSMNAEDIVPSRIEKAKFEIRKLINMLKGDRVAIIVFAGSSHLYLPLTSDYEAALLFLQEIDTDMIPNQGTNLSAAMNTALTAFTDESDKFKVMIVVSDGEDHEGEAVELASKVASMGMVVNTVGVGSKEGSLIPINKKTITSKLIGEKAKGKQNKNVNIYKRDDKGSLITSVLNEKILKDIAISGGGTYFFFGNQDESHQEIVNSIKNMEKKIISTHEFSEYENRYQIFSIFSLILLIISFVLPTRQNSRTQ